MPDSTGQPDKLNKEERCLHYIGMHAQMYGAPADQESVESIMEKYHELTKEQIDNLLSGLEQSGRIKYWEGKYTEGWIIPEVSE